MTIYWTCIIKTNELNNVPPVTADLRKSSALPAFALNLFENADVINFKVSLKTKINFTCK